MFGVLSMEKLMVGGNDESDKKKVSRPAFLKTHYRTKTQFDFRQWPNQTTVTVSINYCFRLATKQPQKLL